MKKIRSGTLLFIVFVGVLCSAGTIRKIDQEYKKSEESGKLRAFYNQLGELDGTGDERIYTVAEKTAKEIEKYAYAESNLALCDLASFYGPKMASNEGYKSNDDLALKWLIVAEKRGLDCEIERKWYSDVLGIGEAKANGMSSLEYMFTAITVFVPAKEVKKNYKYYHQAKKWIAERKQSKKVLKTVSSY